MIVGTFGQNGISNKMLSKNDTGLRLKIIKGHK